MTAAPDHLGTLRGALSDWLYDPRHTAAPYEAQAAHADAIEAALAECKREGLGEVGRELSRGHGWEDTAACWVWRLPRWEDETSTLEDEIEIEMFMGVEHGGEGLCRWHLENIVIDWWSFGTFSDKPARWTICDISNFVKLSLKSPEGLALLDTVRPKVTP